MALFSTYEAFQSSVQRRLNRPVIGRFDEWIAIVETWLENGHAMVVGRAEAITPPLRLATLVRKASYEAIPGDGIAYPADFLSAISLTASTDAGQADVPLRFRTPALFDETEYSLARDASYTVEEGVFRFSADVSAPVRLLYRQQIPKLTAESLATHPVWTNDAQAYLFGALAVAHREFRNKMEEEANYLQYQSSVMGHEQARRARDGGCVAAEGRDRGRAAVIARLGAWQPDQPRFQLGRPSTLRILEASNMRRPVGRWIASSNFEAASDAVALPSAALDSWQFRLDDNSRHTFVAGSDGHLYRPDGNGWSRVSTGATARRWTLARYGNAIYASAPSVRLNKWTPDSPAAFARVDDTPIGAHVLRAYKRFLIAANYGASGVQDVRWSGIGAPEDWNDEGDNSAGRQTVPDLGPIHDIVALEDVYLFCEKGVARMSLTADEFTFQIDTLTRDVGVTGPGLVKAVGRVMYAATTEGIMALGTDGYSEAIGSGSVDETYKRLVDPTLTTKSSVFYDQSERAIRWSFARQQSDYPDTTFVYALDSRTWGYDFYPNPVRFIQNIRGLTFADAARLGGTFGELARVASTFKHPRLARGNDVTHGFTAENKAGPVAGRSRGHVVTTLFSPASGMHRVMLSGVRPLGNGSFSVAARSFESLDDSPDDWVEVRSRQRDGLRADLGRAGAIFSCASGWRRAAATITCRASNSNGSGTASCDAEDARFRYNTTDMPLFTTELNRLADSIGASDLTIRPAHGRAHERLADERAHDHGGRRLPERRHAGRRQHQQRGQRRHREHGRD